MRDLVNYGLLGFGAFAFVVTVWHWLRQPDTQLVAAVAIATTAAAIASLAPFFSWGQVLGLVMMFWLYFVLVGVMAFAFYCQRKDPTIRGLVITGIIVIAISVAGAYVAVFHTSTFHDECSPNYDRQGAYRDC